MVVDNGLGTNTCNDPIKNEDCIDLEECMISIQDEAETSMLKITQRTETAMMTLDIEN